MLNNKQEKRERVNRLLTLFIGECWHEWKIRYDELSTCSCGLKGSYVRDICTKSNPDFFTPNDFDRLRKWMEENHAELWERYLKKVFNTVPAWNTSNGKAYTEAFNAQLNPSNLVQFLVEHRDSWEWLEYPKCEERILAKKELVMTINARNGECKIQHPAAKYLDSIEKEEWEWISVSNQKQ